MRDSVSSPSDLQTTNMLDSSPAFVLPCIIDPAHDQLAYDPRVLSPPSEVGSSSRKSAKEPRATEVMETVIQWFGDAKVDYATALASAI